MTNESDLVPLHMHNLLTVGPAPWTDTRVPSEVWHVARAVYGTSTEDDEKRAYRTVQAALWKAGIPSPAVEAAPQPEAQPRWQPIETAPKDGSTFLCWVAAERWSDMDGGGSGRAHDVSQIDFCWWRDNQGNGYFDPACGQIGDSQGVTHWMPLPAAPSAQAEPTDTAGALMQQIREVCAATLKAGPGVAVPMPDAVRSEMQLFMRGEPNLIERLPFCDVVALSESEEVQALAAPSAQAEPYRCPAKRGEDPQVCGRVRCQLGRKCADEAQAEQGGK